MAELNGQHINGDNEITQGDETCTRLAADVFRLFNWDIAPLDISEFTHRHQSWQASLVCTKI